jgi:hypothetical protein
MSEELRRHVATVTAQPSKALRLAVLERVPFHLRDKVKAMVEAEWKKRRGKR